MESRDWPPRAGNRCATRAAAGRYGMSRSAMCGEHIVESSARCTVTGHMVGHLLQRPDASMTRKWQVLPESEMSG
jgi:hypothetical protein